MTTKKPKKKKHADPIEKILARHDFTPAEMSTLGQEAGRLTTEINHLKEEAKSVAADYKSRVDFKEAARNTVAGKLTNGYELRETECFVKFDTKHGKKKYFDKKTKAFVREDDMTKADWQLPMFSKEEDKAMQKPGTPAAAPEPKKKAKREAGKTNVGDAVIRGIVEAANAQPKVELDMSTAVTEFPVPAKLVKAFKDRAKKTGWPKNVIDNLAKLALASEEKGIMAVGDVLKPFTIQQ